VQYTTFSRWSSAGRTGDREYLFGCEFTLFHDYRMKLHSVAGLFNFGQYWPDKMDPVCERQCSRSRLKCLALDQETRVVSRQEPHRRQAADWALEVVGKSPWYPRVFHKDVATQAFTNPDRAHGVLGDVTSRCTCRKSRKLFQRDFAFPSFSDKPDISFATYLPAFWCQS
jgi:hypothetical protein